MATLNELTDDIFALFGDIEANDGALTDELEVRLDKLVADFKAKGAGYIYVINEVKAQAKALKELSDKYAAKAKAKTRTCDSIKERLMWAMVNTGTMRVETDYGNLNVSYTDSIECESADGLPDKFTNPPIPVDATPNKKDMRAGFLAFLKPYRPKKKADAPLTEDDVKAHFRDWCDFENIPDGAAQLNHKPGLRIT